MVELVLRSFVGVVLVTIAGVQRDGQSDSPSSSTLSPSSSTSDSFAQSHMEAVWTATPSSDQRILCSIPAASAVLLAEGSSISVSEWQGFLQGVC
jgi:hypothetical protein